MAARSVRPPVDSTTVSRPSAAITSIACSTLARQAAVENGRTIPVVPRIEMPPTIPSLGLVVLRAIHSPSGTLITTSAPPSSRSSASPTAAVIWRRGTGLIAGPPTTRPRPGRVTVPTPSPPSSRSPGSARRLRRAVSCAPLVTSGSSPASLTTTASAQPSPSSHLATGNETRRAERGRPISTRTTGRPLSSAVAAALAAAAAQVPVVQPVRRVRAATLAVRGSSGSRRSGPPRRVPVPPTSRSGPPTGRSGAWGSGPRRCGVSSRLAIGYLRGRLGAAELVAERRVVQVRAPSIAAGARQGGPDQDQRLLVDVDGPEPLGQAPERATDHDLVRPARAVHHGAGRLRRVTAGLQLGLERTRARAGEEQRHGGLRASQLADPLARRHRVRGAGRQSGEHDRLGDAWDGQLAADRGRGRSERGDTRDDLPREVALVAFRDLLLDGAVERWVAGVDARHRERRGVEQLGPRRGVREHLRADQARGPDHHVGRGDRRGASEGEQVGGARPGADEPDLRPLGPHASRRPPGSAVGRGADWRAHGLDPLPGRSGSAITVDRYGPGRSRSSAAGWIVSPARPSRAP